MKQSISIKKTAFRTILGSLLLSVGPSIFVGAADAATIAWWRFEDPANTGFASEANSGIMAATQGSNSVRTEEASGPYILDGTTGTAHSNGESVFHTWNSSASIINNSTATTLLNDVFVNNGQSWTLEAIINKPGVQNYATIFGNGDPSGQGLNFSLGADGLTFTLITNGVALSGPTIPMGEWVHLAVVANSTGVSVWDLNIYVNYELETTLSSIELTAQSTDYRIGGAVSPSAGNPMIGYLDELRISDTALTTAQMLSAQAIPEPSMVVLVSLTGVVLACRRRNLLKMKA